MATRPEYNVLSICAGVGGLELGVRIARPDARAICYLEREIPAASVLAARIADGSLHPAPIWSDLTTFDPEPWRGIVDCITSGDPCQPNSVAGKHLGADDDRWLLDHILHIIEVVRPARVFRENVVGNSDGQLAAIVPALEGMGYRVAAGIFSAGEDAQANHRRERLFIMADRQDVGHERSGSAWRWRSGDPDRGECMVNPPSLGRRKGRPEPVVRRGRHSAGVSDGDMGDPERGTFRAERRAGDDQSASSPEREARQRKRLRPDDRPAGSAMGNPLRSRNGRFAPKSGRSEKSGEAVDGAGGGCGAGVANPDSPRPQGQRERSGSQGREVAPGYARLSDGTELPIFAPGPSDPAWPRIIAERPHLSPAVSDFDQARLEIVRAFEGVGEEGAAPKIESALRGMDARLAGRVDRLRECGNGVSSLAAAVAWLTLDARLAEG